MGQIPLGPTLDRRTIASRNRDCTSPRRVCTVVSMIVQNGGNHDTTTKAAPKAHIATGKTHNRAFAWSSVPCHRRRQAPR